MGPSQGIPTETTDAEVLLQHDHFSYRYKSEACKIKIVKALSKVGLASPAKQRELLAGKEKHVNTNKFGGLSRDCVGCKIVFMCFVQITPYGRGKRINKITPKSLDNPMNSLFTCFFYVGLIAPST